MNKFDKIALTQITNQAVIKAGVPSNTTAFPYLSYTIAMVIKGKWKASDGHLLDKTAKFFKTTHGKVLTSMYNALPLGTEPRDFIHVISNKIKVILSKGGDDDEG